MRAPGDSRGAHKRQLERGGLESENGWRLLMARRRFSVGKDTCHSARLESCAEQRVRKRHIDMRNCAPHPFALTVLAHDGRGHHRFGARPRVRDAARGLGH
jgi:hypothetical protein